MGEQELYQRMEEKIALCEQQYETVRENAFLSTSRHSELETLRELYDRLRHTETAQGMLDRLKQLLPEAEEMREREAVTPSFDWYNEHYYYEVFDGQCEAYRSVIELLEEAEENRQP